MKRYFQKNNVFNTTIMLPAIIFLMVVLVFPLGWSFYTSLTSLELLSPGDTEFIGLNNYINSVKDANFLNALKNNTWFTIVSLCFQLTISLAIAYLLSSKKLALRGLYRTILLLPMFVAAVVVGFQWKWLFIDRYGIINQILKVFGVKEIYWLTDKFLAKISIIIADSWNAIPFMVLVIHASMLMVPTDIYESSQIDGANEWNMFRYITLPFIKPAILLVLIIRGMDSLKIFDAIYILTKGGPANETELLSLYIFRQAFTNFKMGYASALSFLQFILILIFSVFLIKTLIKK